MSQLIERRADQQSYINILPITNMENAQNKCQLNTLPHKNP